MNIALRCFFIWKKSRLFGFKNMRYLILFFLLAAAEFTAHCGPVGAKIAFLGDSITDRRHIGCTSNYWNFLERDLGIVPLVYGINGHQMKHLSAQAEKLKADHPDGLSAIFVFAGTNDYNSDTPLGEWWTISEEMVNRGAKGMVKVRRRKFIYGDETFRGRINKVMRFIKDGWPGVPVYLITPIHRGYATFGPTNVQPDESYSNAIGLFIDDYVAVIKEAGNVWAADVIDLHAESGLFPLLKSHSRFFSDAERDMLHPNDAGHELMARAIMRHLAPLAKR
jgi:lysophospholipase L1-like esterase